ncbi:MAG: hypothetical protein K2G23_02785 [Muribaculaceae bacterium]|nr:hypothetical protein [Muribaculaceae bacterium]
MDVLNRAEDLMETHPDSSLQILNSIEKTNLSSSEEKARYALLMSMALDKNYIDTTTFDVLQPAIDYYLSKGTADEKMRTYYYQGCIFNNQGKFEKALDSFMKSVHNSSGCSDSLLLGRSHVFQGCLFYDFYDFKSYMDEYQQASEIFKRLDLKDREFECLLNVLNGAVIIKDRNRADSLARVLESFEMIDSMQKSKLQTYILPYIITFGTKDEVRKYLNSQENTEQPTLSEILNLASAYNTVGENQYALQLLKYVEDCGEKYDTLKLKSINVSVFEDIENYKKAFETYREFSQLSDSIDLSRFEQKILSINDRYQFELKTEREAKRRNNIIYLCLCGLIVFAGVIVILVLGVKNQRTKKELALERANNVTLENHKLQAEKELALERAKLTEIENSKLNAERELALERAKLAESDNEKLRIQKELALEQSKNVELENRTLKSEQERITAENRNLQLERDKKALEAENLAHRVESLEEESESLKTLLNTPEDLPQEVRDAIKTRVEMLNSLLASYITTNDKIAAPYDVWVKELTANTEKFMDSNRLAFTASHPRFIKYFEDHDLTVSEINYLCLYALGLKGKEVGNYIKKRSHVNISSAIRKKLGIDKHETNIGIYVRKLLKSL